MAQIFLSYSRADADAAKLFANALSELGHDVWWDKHISGGSAFAGEIEQALNDADVVLVLWSEAAVKSPWVLDEAAEGRDSGRLLPVALGNCKPPLGFRQYQTIAAQSACLEQAVDDIVRALAGKSGKGQAGITSVSPQSVEALCAKARGLAEQGQFEKAKQQIEAALSLEPLSADVNREAARLMYVEGQPAEAIGYCEQALASEKRDYQTASLLISCCRAMGNADGSTLAAELAVAAAEQSIASGSSMGAAFASGAKGLAVLGERERARKWARKALNVDPGNLAVRYQIASTLAAFVEDSEAAIDTLEAFAEGLTNRAQLQLLEVDPDLTPIRERRDFQSLLARARKRVEALEATAFAGQPSSVA